jgi:hypothetical protein
MLSEQLVDIDPLPAGKAKSPPSRPVKDLGRGQRSDALRLDGSVGAAPDERQAGRTAAGSLEELDRPGLHVVERADPFRTFEAQLL